MRWSKMNSEMVKVIIISMLLVPTVIAAPWEYYDDSMPRIKSETIQLYTTGNCSYTDFALLKIAFESWGVVEVELVNDFTNFDMYYDQRFTLDCQASREKSVEFDQQLPLGIEHAVSNTTGSQAQLYWDKSAEILDCDIVLFEDAITTLNLRKVMRHESGHCLGLPHSTDGSSLMAPSPIVGVQQIEDIARIAVLYGDCDVVVDEYGTAFIPRAKFFGEQEVFQGFIRAGEAYDVELAMCEL